MNFENNYIIVDNDNKRRGGNGQVYFVKQKCKDSKEFALKKVIFRNLKMYNRFKREIEINKKIEDIEGILKIYDSYFPNKFKRDKIGWYVMDKGTSIDLEKFSKQPIEKIIKEVLYVAKTLAELHRRNIVHRDIKPENLLFFNNKLCLIDFGLVDFPKSTPITDEGERLGAWTTIAPEFRRNASKSDGKKGDIYSFAKTVWILLTGEKDGFDGQYQYKDEKIKLMPYRKKLNEDDKNIPLSILEDFLIQATENDPDKRCNIEEAIGYLEKFLNDDRIKKVNYEWEFISKVLFPYSIPKKTLWNTPKDIVKILKEITYFNGLNHNFFEVGGMDLIDVTLSNEEGFIELHYDGLISKLKPKALNFYSFENSEWNYFLLEIEKLDKDYLSDLAIEENIAEIELVELKPRKYIPGWCKYYGRNMISSTKEKFNENSRVINLFILENKVVIFCKTSTFNTIPSTYSGYQNFFSNEDFYQIISLCQIWDPKEIFDEILRKIRIYTHNLNEYFFIKYNKKITKEEEKRIFKSYFLKYLFDIKKLDFRIERLNKKIEEIEKLDEEKIINFESFSITDLDISSMFKPEFDKLPLKYPTIQELDEVLLNGNSFISNTLVCDLDGNIKLIPSSNKEEIELYPIKISDFPAYQNSVGEFYNDNKIALNCRYNELLNYFYRLLITKRKVSYVDWFEDNIEEKIKEIINKKIESVNLK